MRFYETLLSTVLMVHISRIFRLDAEKGGMLAQAFNELTSSVHCWEYLDGLQVTHSWRCKCSP
jgi:hypothetical protein